MAKLAAALVVGTAVLGLVVPASAYHCPLLVKECQALVGKMEKRANADQGMVGQAKKGCQEALDLHNAGKHKESVMTVGEAITLAGKSAK